MEWRKVALASTGTMGGPMTKGLTGKEAAEPREALNRKTRTRRKCIWQEYRQKRQDFSGLLGWKKVVDDLFLRDQERNKVV